MASDWPLVPLKSVAEVFTGFPFKGDAYLPPGSGIRVVRGDNVTENKVRWGEKEKCWASVTAELANYVLRAGDLVIGMDGSRVGRNFATISVDDDGSLLAQRVARLRAKGPMHQAFLKYSVCNQAFSDYVRSIHTGTSIPHISKGQIQNFGVYLPPTSEQAAIANALGSLDDRIDHNRALATNLEAIARRLFKSWFVEFDPVRAKATGEKPAGLADDLAALFPDRFVESELGEIPEGWSCRKVSDLCEAIFSGGTPHTQTPEYWGGELLWLSSGETRSRFVVGTEKTITEAGVKNSSTKLARAGDIVIASAGQGATRGQTSLLAIDTYINQSVVVLRAATESSSSALLFLDLSSRYDEMRAISDSHSSRGSLTTKLLGGMKSIAPPAPVVAAFVSLVSPLIERIVVAERETSRLGTIRDLLLPRLISGKLRVADAESLIEEAIA